MHDIELDELIACATRIIRGSRCPRTPLARKGGAPQRKRGKQWQRSRRS